MSYVDILLKSENHPKISDYTSWQKKYSFNTSSEIYNLGDFTIYNLGNGLVAKTILDNFPFCMANGKWVNEKASPAILALENNFWIAKGLSEKGISIPKPEGLFLVRREDFNSYHPSYVIENIPNDYPFLSEIEKREIRSRATFEVEKAKSFGFFPGFEEAAKLHFLYSKHKDVDGKNGVFLVGLSNWKKR